MHKTRHFLPPGRDIAPGSYDLYNPKLRLVSVPKEELKITYDFETYIIPLIDAASKQAGQVLPVREGHVVVPVHELQVPHIQRKFPTVEVYPAEFSLPLLAQQSIR